MREAKGAAHVGSKDGNNVVQSGASPRNNLAKAQDKISSSSSVAVEGSSRSLISSFSSDPGEGSSTGRKKRKDSNQRSSVRLNFSLPAQAASRLQQLASSKDGSLSRLGVLSLKVAEEKTVHLSNGPTSEPPAKKKKSVPEPQTLSRFSTLLSLLNSLAAINDGSRGAATSSSSKISIPANGNPQPNVVAGVRDPIPIVPSGQHPTPSGPFAFSSMTKVASSIKMTIPTTSGATMPSPTSASVVVGSHSTGKLIPPASSPEILPPPTPIAKPPNRTIAMNSPLLVNLLQGTESDAPVAPGVPVSPVTSSTTMPAPAAGTAQKPPRVRKPRIKKDPVTGEPAVNPEKPAKTPRAPRKKKAKNDVESTNGPSNPTNGAAVPIPANVLLPNVVIGSSTATPIRPVGLVTTSNVPTRLTMSTNLLGGGSAPASFRFSFPVNVNRTVRPPIPLQNGPVKSALNGETGEHGSNGKVGNGTETPTTESLSVPVPADLLGSLLASHVSKSQSGAPMVFIRPANPNPANHIKVFKAPESPVSNGPLSDLGMVPPSPTSMQTQRSPPDSTFKQPDVPKDSPLQVKTSASPLPAEYSPKLVSVPSPTIIQKQTVDPQ